MTVDVFDEEMAVALNAGRRGWDQTTLFTTSLSVQETSGVVPVLIFKTDRQTLIRRDDDDKPKAAFGGTSTRWVGRS